MDLIAGSAILEQGSGPTSCSSYIRLKLAHPHEHRHSISIYRLLGQQEWGQNWSKNCHCQAKGEHGDERGGESRKEDGKTKKSFRRLGRRPDGRIDDDEAANIGPSRIEDVAILKCRMASNGNTQSLQLFVGLNTLANKIANVFETAVYVIFYICKLLLT